MKTKNSVAEIRINNLETFKTNKMKGLVPFHKCCKKFFNNV